MPMMTTRSGAMLHVEERGEGPPLVLIHGNFVSSRMWDPQIATFAEQFRVVRYDVRGFGRSPLGAGPVAHHDDVDDLRHALGLGPLHVVGVSMGASIALDLAITHPEAVRSMVLVPGGVAGWTPPAWMESGWAELQGAIEARDAVVARDILLRFPPMRSLDLRPAVRREVQAMIDVHPWFEAADDAEELTPDPPAASRLAEVSQPTLVVSGSLDDPAFLELGDLLVREMPSAQRLVLEGAGHMVSMELAEAFNAAVIGFVQSVEAA